MSLTVDELSEEFGKTNTDITWGITLVLMFRSVGSIIFGIASDRYGRKWPFVVNNILFIALELVSNNSSIPIISILLFVCFFFGGGDLRVPPRPYPRTQERLETTASSSAAAQTRNNANILSLIALLGVVLAKKLRFLVSTFMRLTREVIGNRFL